MMPTQPNGLPAAFLTRSWLVIPPVEDAAVKAGLISGADVLVLDLSAIAPASRRDASERLGLYLAQPRDRAGEPAIFIGIPGIDADTETLLADLLPCRPQGIMLMEFSEPRDVQALDVLLSVEEAVFGIDDGETRIAALMAHGLGLSVAGFSRRLVALGWSAGALQRLSGARRMHDSEGHLTQTFAQARASVLLAAAQAQVEALDTASGLFSTDRLARDCREAVADGFTGKLALSPRQVTAINHGFLPSHEELEEARAILADLDRASEPERLRALRTMQRVMPQKD